MDAIRLDYRAKAQSGWIGFAVFTAGISAALFTGWQVADQSRQVSREVAELQHISQKSKVLEKAPKRNEASTLQVREANAVIERLRTPWEPMFKSIEEMPNADVALLEFKPDAHKGIVRISAEAKNLESQLDYVTALQKNPLFLNVTLLSHQIYDQDQQNPVRFMLQMEWRGMR